MTIELMDTPNLTPSRVRPPASQKRDTNQKPSRSKDSYFYQMIRVDGKNGRTTTVSIDLCLATIATRKLGGLEPLRQLVRDVSKTYNPAQHKAQYRTRSGFVANCIMLHLDEITRTGAANPRPPQLHPHTASMPLSSAPSGE